MVKNLEKYKGLFPAFYACYDDNGNISKERTKIFTRHLIDKGVDGLYVCGSSGECIYQNIDERQQLLEAVMEEAYGKIPVIAHIAATSTRDSIALAKHAKTCNVDAVAAIPPIYFKLPDISVEKYWLDIIEATDLDFFIYNIPQTTNYTLSNDLFKRMIANEKVVGIKNSSPYVLDIQGFKALAMDKIIFNGPDEQYIAGRIMGATGGIGGTYGVMPELFIALENNYKNGNIDIAQEIQFVICDIIYTMCSCKGNLYSVMKEIIKINGIDLGGTRAPLEPVHSSDMAIVKRCNEMIKNAVIKYKV